MTLWLWQAAQTGWSGRGRRGFAGTALTHHCHLGKEQDLLNNRQPGRRRGRNNQRPQGNSGGRNQDNGNRVDNRARGNAPQLLEKYKTLARDSQMQGDRVMTEYYHQFADHYFRVTAEMRARFEENRKQRDDWQGEDGDEGGFDDRPVGDASDNDDYDAASERAYEAQRRQPQQNNNREPREYQGNRDSRDANDNRDNRPPAREPRDNRPPQRETRERAEGERNDRSPRRDGRDNANRDAASRDNMSRENTGRDNVNRDTGNRIVRNRPPRFQADDDSREATIDINVLPPAFGSDGPISPMAELDFIAETSPVGDSDDTPAPRRRGRPRKVAAEAEAAE